MRANHSPESPEHASVLTIGVTDLMTSLAVIFILLFSAYVTKVSETEPQAKVQPPMPTVDRNVAKSTREDMKGLLRDHFQRFDLSLDADPADPNVVRIVVPDALLNFEFGKGRCRRSQISSWWMRCRPMRRFSAVPCAIGSIRS